MLTERIQQVKKEAQAIYAQMSGEAPPEITVILDSDCFSAAADTKYNSIHINPHHLLNKEELRKHYPGMKNILYKGLDTKPVLGEKARQFVLAHEVAHLYLGHQDGTWDYNISLVTTLLAGKTLFTIFSSWSLGIILFTIQRVSWMILRIPRSYFERYMEHEADLTAVKALKDFKGFKWFCLVAEALKSRSWAHPPPLERLEYVQSRV